MRTGVDGLHPVGGDVWKIVWELKESPESPRCEHWVRLPVRCENEAVTWDRAYEARRMTRIDSAWRTG
ncbi:hypothetical protein [Aporhodopirellula aestuarii]|uniref:Uncharacterized protein n=1 Tax=Aporhodopirellula aestuarii TaxID=2950107 RepID=A0ABT0UDW8_9BACT|nr:hypothetical protein [Aporhodopirellula aestuarii]MCM2375253.1 hypothetical protein [Aporhodopirellula aestuarii]